MPWNDEFECMPVEKLKAFQLEKLKETVAWIGEKVPFYRNRFKEMGIGPDDLKSLEDVAKLPFTVKDDLRDNYPFQLCAVPLEDVVRVHASSGTTGKPITGPYTAEDLEQWSECMARNLYAAGVRKEDIVQNAYGYGLFTGGLGFHQGATKIGCTIVPTSSGLTERQITLMQDFGTTVLLPGAQPDAGPPDDAHHPFHGALWRGPGRPCPRDHALHAARRGRHGRAGVGPYAA